MKMYKMEITARGFWTLMAMTTLAVGLGILTVGRLSYMLGEIAQIDQFEPRLKYLEGACK